MLAQDAVVRYEIDPRASKFSIKASAAGLLSALGHNPTIAVRDYSGEASFVPHALDQASIRVTARPDSFEVTDDISEKDKREIETRMKQDVLETDRFPEISFESSVVSVTQMGDDTYAVNVTGTLSLHGTAHSQRIIAQVTVNGDSFRAFGEFSLRQTDYGIELVSVAGGTLKVKDEVKCSFDIVARKQA